MLGSGDVARVARLFTSRIVCGQRVGAGGLAPIGDLVTAGGAVGRIAARELGAGVRPVRALLFDKTESANWALGWHQDRTIAVRARQQCAGFERWSVKTGQPHVEPPADLAAAMVTLRIHLDRVDAGNAPLLILPGSHRLGRLTEEEIFAFSKKQDAFACLAEPGDVRAYSTPIVHSSGRQARPGRRRVLQIDYAAADLPGGLEWVDLVGS